MTEIAFVADCAMLMVAVFCLWGIWFVWNEGDPK